MSSSTDKWGGSRTLEHFCQHLVALCITYKTSSDTTERESSSFAAYAGTLIRIRHMVAFLTAGHALRQVEEALQSSVIEIQSAILADTFGRNRVSDLPIPFDLRSASRFYIDDDHEGLDFGLIVLEPYYLRLLSANGVVAIEEKNWRHQSDIRFDSHLMLGLPAAFTSNNVSQSGDGHVSPTMFSVQRLMPPPDDIPPSRHARFVGRIDSDLPLDSLVGMSGGPIFGFNFDPPVRYWVVALQSSWIRERRLVFGCPIPVLGSMLTKWTDDVISSTRMDIPD